MQGCGCFIVDSRDITTRSSWLVVPIFGGLLGTSLKGSSSWIRGHLNSGTAYNSRWYCPTPWEL